MLVPGTILHHFNMEALDAKKYRNEVVNKTLELIRERKDDEVYDVSNFYFLSHPERINPFRVKDRRKAVIQRVKEALQKCYDKKKPMFRDDVGRSSYQERFFFSPSFRDIYVCGLEVECYMISSSGVKDQQRSYNVSRISHIQFKGEMADIMMDLHDRCKEEIQTRFRKVVGEVFEPAAYPPEHKKGICKWPCERMEEASYKRFSQFFDYKPDEKSKKVCFSHRQVIGYDIMPYIVRSDEDDEATVDNTTYVFDNMFINKGELLGLEIPVEDIKRTNFLDTVDRERCSAIISFKLSHVGVGDKGGMTIYLTMSNSKTYCALSYSDRNITSCSEYLENQALYDKGMQGIIKTRKGIDMDGQLQSKKREKEDCDEEEEEPRKQFRNDDSEEDGDDIKDQEDNDDDDEEEEQGQNYKMDQEKFLQLL